MKKLAILAAAAIGYALANRVGRKQDLGFSGPTPARPDYAPAGTDPFVASAQEAPLRVVEDLPEEPVNDEATPKVVADEPVVEEVFTPVDADPHALSDAAAAVDEAIEAELNAEPTVDPVIADIVPNTPVAETQEEPEVGQSEVEQISPPSWVDDMPAATPDIAEDQTPVEETAAESSEESGITAEATPEPKLSEIAEGINERIRTAADLAREEEPVATDLDEPESEGEATGDEEPSSEAFVVPTAEDFADEVFEGESRADAPESSADGKEG